MKNTRRCQVYETNHWKDIEFKDLVIGDIFRLFEDTGEEVVNNNETSFIALSKPYLNEDGIWCVKTN